MKWFKRILVLILLLLVAGFFGIPMLLETGWAKERIRSAMAAETGRDVELGDIRFSWFEGLRVSDVSVGQKPGDRADEGPLFRLDTLDLRVGLSDLLAKKINVERFTVDEPLIVIVRDEEGRFNFADLLDRPSAPAEPASGGPGAKVTARLDITDGRILYIDEPLGSRVEAKGIDATANYAEGRVDLTMGFDLNGGEVVLKANADLSRKPSPFTVSELTIDGAEFTGELSALDLFIPLAGDRPESASGKLNFSLRDLTGTGFDLESLKRTLSGKGDLALEGGTLLSGPVTKLYSAFRGLGAGDLGALTAAGGSGEALSFKMLRSSFRIADGKVLTDDMSLTGAGMDLSLKGFTRLDGKIKYEMIAANLQEFLARNEKVKKALGGKGTIPLTLGGFLADPEVSVDLKGALEGAARDAVEGAIRDKLPGGVKDLFGGEKDDGGKKKKKKKKKKKNGAGEEGE